MIGRRASKSPLPVALHAVPPGLLFAALLLGIRPQFARAQAVSGRIVSSDGSPAAWVLVRLVRPDGSEVATTVSSPSGSFRLRADGPGLFRVRAERIGFEPTLSDTLRLAAAATASLELRTVDAPIQLDAISVRAEKPMCGLRPDEGSKLMMVWAEIRKALELEAATGASGRFVFRAQLHDYVVDQYGDPADPEQARERTEQVVVRAPLGFHAADPERLAERGFRWKDGALFAPDARTLLSEPFQTTHCYGLKREGERIGVTFEPPERSGSRVDVAGTLWIDAETAELRTLEYDYVWTDFSPVGTRGGGYLEFEQLPDGAWIVRRWWIREPVNETNVTNARRRTFRVRKGYYWETGGRVTQIERPPSPVVASVRPSPELLEGPPSAGAAAADIGERAGGGELAAGGERATGNAVTRDAAASGPEAADRTEPPPEIAAALSLFRGPPGPEEVADLLAAHPDFAVATDPRSVATRAALRRRARELERALATLDSVPDGGGLVAAERARVLFALERPDEAATAFRTACASGDSLALEALWADLRGLATPAELAGWKERPVSGRCAWLGQLVAERALRTAQTESRRLALHYRRLAHAREWWRLARPRYQGGTAARRGRAPDLELDDRGLVYLRMGEPDETAHATVSRIDPSTGSMGERVEVWRYDRPGGHRILTFSPVTRLSEEVGDYRLQDAMWRVVSPLGKTRALGALEPLSEMYLAFQGLDPSFAVRAYRIRNGGAPAVQELTEDERSSRADVAFAVDSVPDAPAVRPGLSFAWERLRFYDPSSEETVVWLVTAAPADQLTAAPGGEDTGPVCRLTLSAAARRGTSVTVDSARVEVRPGRTLGGDASVTARLPIRIAGPPVPLTLVLRDANERERPAGNWARSSVTPFSPSGLPEISDLAVAQDSGGAWSRDGETYLPVTPVHVTGPDGSFHLYFEVYGIPAGRPYDVELRAVREADAGGIWTMDRGDAAYRLTYESEMPRTGGGIGRHHLHLDLSGTREGAYVLGVRVRDPETDTWSLPVTTPVTRRR